MYKLIIKENEAGQRLDRFLRKYLKRAPLSAIYKIIRKDLKVNGKRAREDRMLEAGDELTFYMAEEEIEDLAKATSVRAARRQFKIAYEDGNVLIVDKPAGLLTHGDKREKSNTLTNQVCGYLQQKGEYDPSQERIFHPSPVNRLDRNTSGLVIFGKNAEATRQLAALLRERGMVRKFYRTIVCGELNEEVVVDESLIKDEARNMVSVAGSGSREDKSSTGVKYDGSREPADAKESRTIVRPVRAGRDFSVAEVELLTGRTHQIRVHMAHIDHPLAGDPKYGDRRINGMLKESGVSSQLLHACRLEFSEDIGEPAVAGLAGKVVEAELPGKFRKAEADLL